VKETRGTAEWAYRCTPKGTDTRRLLDEAGFLWRSLHSSTGKRIPSVAKVEVGDTIHVFFTEGGVETYVASYLVKRPVEVADDTAPAIDAVRSGELFEQLTDAGYELDSELGCFTGFRVARDVYARIVDQKPPWVARNVLARIKR
jgi:hypothetical protein